MKQIKIFYGYLNNNGLEDRVNEWLASNSDIEILASGFTPVVQSAWAGTLWIVYRY